MGMKQRLGVVLYKEDQGDGSVNIAIRTKVTDNPLASEGNVPDRVVKRSKRTAASEIGALAEVSRFGLPFTDNYEADIVKTKLVDEEESHQYWDAIVNIRQTTAMGN